MTRRSVGKRVAHWTVPPGIQELIRTRLFAVQHNKQKSLVVAEREILSRNAVLHNRHHGERCFILATGPSIKKQDLKLLQGEICIAVSNFFVHPDYELIHPKYYCIAPYHPPITEDGWQSWMQEVAQHTPHATMFFGASDKDRNELRGWFREHQVHYLQFGSNWANLPIQGVNCTAMLPPPQSVSVMALFVALYMGFSEIYLLGCDHDWILHLNESKHFYEEDAHALNRANYNEWSGTDFETVCWDYIRLWQQYKLIRELSLNTSVQICNATVGGILDVFPRVHLTTALKSRIQR